MSVRFNDTQFNNTPYPLKTALTAHPPESMSSRSKNIDAFETVAGNTGYSPSVLSLSADLSAKKTDEETERQIDTVDNRAKTLALLGQRNISAANSMERVAYGKDISEAAPMILDFNPRFNCSGPDLKSLDIGCGGPAYGWISVVSYVVREEFKDGKQYSYWPDGKHVYNDDHAMTTVEGDESTPDNPIMYTMSKDKDTGGFAWYKISINRVDPRNATREEMFAYLMYHNKDTGTEAHVNAQCMFTEIDAHGVEYGLFAENQLRTDYVKAFEMQADNTRRLLETTDIPNMPGVKDNTQAYYDELLQMVDKIIEHTDKTRARLELQNQTDIKKPEKPEEPANRQNAGTPVPD